MPHQCAHWFAMTCRRKDVCAGARTLLAMTCKRLPRCYVCKRVLPGQARNRPQIRLKCYFFLPFPAGTRIATPVCALVRNDMQKEGRVRGGKNVARNDMQKIAALLRVQEGACRGKSATAHEFALSATFSWLFLRGRGLPRRFAPRNDRLKTDTRLRLQGRTWDSSPRKGEPFAGPPCTGSQ